VKWSWLILVLTGVTLAAEPVYTPASSVVFALADARTVPASRQPYLRYLSAYQAIAAERPDYASCVSFLVNSLSRERTITRPLVVPGSDGTVIRVLLDDYQLSPAAWDKLIATGSGPLASQTPEPYFQTRIASLVETFEDREVPKTRQIAYRDAYGRPGYREERYTALERVKTGTKPTIALATAPWVPTNEMAALVALTQSQTPIVRADWLITFASWAPGYYSLLGLGSSTKDFERLVFADEKLAAKARAQVKGAVTFSGVALHNRTLNRIPTVSGVLGGYYWESHDANKSIDGADFINVLLDEKFDATEIIASLPNGLQAYFLADGQWKRLDVAAAEIAQDHETLLQDHQVWAARNCITCHARGIRPIQDEVRGLSRDKIALLVADPKQARRIADLYFSADLTQVVKHDQALFVAAVRAANGLSPEANGALFERIVQGYLDAPLNAQKIAAEAGVTEEQLLAVLRNAAGVDHVLTGLMQSPPRPVRRDHFERAFGQLQVLLGGKR
jgi:hypothetical protein